MAESKKDMKKKDIFEILDNKKAKSFTAKTLVGGFTKKKVYRYCIF
ncbi:MAG: hypothetical protein Fur0012_05900 [Elusimicrobiota bacterium]